MDSPVPDSGKVGESLRFDGATDYVGVADSDLWAFGSSEFTIEFWANFDAPGGGTVGHPGDVFIGNNEGPGITNNKWFFALGGGFLNFHINDPVAGSRFFPLVPFSPSVGQWYHLAVTRSGSTYTIFIDGAAVGSATDTEVIPNPDAPLIIGQANEPFGGFMNGRLDEVTVYRRALAEQEIASIAQADDAGKCKSLTIDTRALSVVRIGDFFSEQLEAVLGEPPYSWSLASGVLPEGVTLSSNGELSGTPTELGTSTFAVEVVDSGGSVAQRVLSLEVVLALPPLELSIDLTRTTMVPGREVSFYAVVANRGSVGAEDVTVFGLLEPWLTLEAASPTPAQVLTTEDTFPATAGGEYDAGIEWGPLSLGPGDSVLLSYTARLDPTYPIASSVVQELCLDSPNDGSGSACESDCYVANFSMLPTNPWAKACDAALKHYCNCRCNGGSDSQCTGVLNGEGGLCGDHEYDPGGTAAASSEGGVGPVGAALCEREETPTVGPLDPNVKVVAASRFVRPDQRLVYPIHFENIGEVEALDVFVTDVLDENHDEGTLELLTPGGGSFDSATRTVRWELFGRNLQPGETDSVVLAIRPLPGLPSGTEIRNSAEIQFEVFDPLMTPEVVTVIDDTPPSCVMRALPEETLATEFEVSWSWTDAVGEPDSFSVFFSENGGAFAPLVGRTQGDSVVFSGEVGDTYGFFCLARDTAGNVETQAPEAEATTRVVSTGSPDTDGDGLPDDIDPDDDNDGIADDLDDDPLVPSNSCTAGTAAEAVFAEVVTTAVTCAAKESITVIPPAEVRDPGHLRLIAPEVIVNPEFKAGWLSVISTDPCVACMELPVITAIDPTVALAGSEIADLQVQGDSLLGATFAFSPELTPPGVNVTAATVGSDGMSATLSVSIEPNAEGEFALVASNSDGSSSAVPTQANTLTVFGGDADPDNDGLSNDEESILGTDPFNVDTDGDGFGDGEEVAAGSSPLLAEDTPISSPTVSYGATASLWNRAHRDVEAPTEADGPTVSVLNATGQGAGAAMAASGVTVSVLNTTGPGVGGSMAASGPTVSVLNATGQSAGGPMAASGATVSVLNTTGQGPGGSMAARGATVSVLNASAAGGGSLTGTSGQLVSVLNTLNADLVNPTVTRGAITSVLNSNAEAAPQTGHARGSIVSVLSESDPTGPAIAETQGLTVSVENTASP